MKVKYSWGVLAATATVAIGLSGTANAADLGGNCCADLEERIAELEATTARKGNRKVSLTVSGWVNEAIFAWDDGVQSDVYIGTNSREQSRVRFVGESKVTSDVTASYNLELGTWGSDSRDFTQDGPDGSRSGTVTVRRSSWSLKSKTLGKVTVGKDATANYHLLDDSNQTQTRTFADPEAFSYALSRFGVRDSSDKEFIPSGTGRLRWSDILQGAQNDVDGQDGLREVVRYDSPEFAGFNVVTTWGEDDVWGVTLNYKGTLGDFDLLGKVGYAETTDEAIRCTPKAGDEDCQTWGISGSALHKPTGLYIFAGYSENHDNNRKAAFGNPSADETDTLLYVQAGLERKWIDLGKTTVFGNYRHDDGGAGRTGSVLVPATLVDIAGSDIDFWGAGVVQKIEAAAMDLYVTYTHADGDFTRTSGAKTDLEAFDVVIAGGRVQF